MNENNLEYLKKTLENLGLGKKLNDVLETAISREMPNFSLGIATRMRPAESKDINAMRTENIDFKINFNRSKESDMYFLNNYKVTLTRKDESIVREQTFDLMRDHRITALQAYKLLSGLSFEKEVYLRSNNENREQSEGQPQKVSMWFKLNLDITDAYGNHPLRTFRPEYGYDLGKTLAKYPIKGLDVPEKLQEAMTTMRNGNYYHGEMTIGKKSVPVTIAANPQIKTIDIYDKNMVEIRDEAIFPEQSKTKKTEQEKVENVSNDPKQTQQVEQPWVREAEPETGRKRGR